MVALGIIAKPIINWERVWAWVNYRCWSNTESLKFRPPPAFGGPTAVDVDRYCDHRPDCYFCSFTLEQSNMIHMSYHIYLMDISWYMILARVSGRYNLVTNVHPACNSSRQFDWLGVVVINPVRSKPGLPFGDLT